MTLLVSFLYLWLKGVEGYTRASEDWLKLEIPITIDSFFKQVNHNFQFYHKYKPDGKISAKKCLTLVGWPFCSGNIKK